MVQTSVELSESTFESEDLNSEDVKNAGVVSPLNLANCSIAERNALKVAIRNAFLSKWCDSQVAKYLKYHGYGCTLSTFLSESHQLDESRLHDVQLKSDISSSSALLSLWESIEMKYNEKFTREVCLICSNLAINYDNGCLLFCDQVCNMESKMENELQLLEQTMAKRLNEEIANLKREYDAKEKSLINEYKALKIDVANEKLAIENEQRIVEEKLTEKAESLKEQEDELVSLAEEVKTWLCREEERINQRKRDLSKQESMIKDKEEEFIKNYDQIVQTIRMEEQQQVDSCYQRMRAKEKKFQQLIKLFLSSEEGRNQALNWVTSERNDRISALQKTVDKLRERLQKFQKENKRLNRQLQANSDYDILQEENKRMTAEIDQLQANWLAEKKNLLRKNYELSKRLKIFEMNNLKRNDSTTDSGAESRKTEDNTSSTLSNGISPSKNPLHNSTCKVDSKFDNLNHYSFLRTAKDLNSRCNFRSETLFHNSYKNANQSDDESSGNFAVANKTDLCEPLDVAEVIDLKIMKLDRAVASYQEDYFTKNTKKMLNSIDSILRNIETLQRNTGLNLSAGQSAEIDLKRGAIISARGIAKNKICDGDDDDDDQARQEHFSQIRTSKEDKMENISSEEIMINGSSKLIKTDDNWESRLLSKNASHERRNDIQSSENGVVVEKSDENEIQKDHQLDELSKNDALIDPIMTKYLQMIKNKRRTEANEDSSKVYPILENDSADLPSNLQFSVWSD
ncbi:hypothetical protein T01_13556 [Trichinella spiralis]|uniref:LisH domain-containing protein n=1 Tax=Trichinella spiralis TaxID=6334 RepID=A0A0V1BJ33_TRISP|nr:hypothetical protein T01_13556 [Trichinella spiralis]